jgi:hypothetical protein
MNTFKATIGLILTILCVSCARKEKATDQNTGIPQVTDAPATYCFRQLSSNAGLTDSLYIQLTINGDSVTGIWNWLPAEKDKMVGTLAGTIHNNEARTIYTYTAEGQTSKEEKLLKIDGDTLRFKTGEMEQRNGIWILRNAETTAYNESLPRVDCPSK